MKILKNTIFLFVILLNHSLFSISNKEKEEIKEFTTNYISDHLRYGNWVYYKRSDPNISKFEKKYFYSESLRFPGTHTTFYVVEKFEIDSIENHFNIKNAFLVSTKQSTIGEFTFNPYRYKKKNNEIHRNVVVKKIKGEWKVYAEMLGTTCDKEGLLKYLSRDPEKNKIYLEVKNIYEQ